MRSAAWGAPHRLRRGRWPSALPPGGMAAVAALWIGLALTAGCSHPAAPPARRVFYPPPPDAPRVQFLCTLGSSDDVRQPPSAFERFVLGGGQSHAAERLIRPYGLGFWDGKLYVCDSGARACVVIDLARKEFRTFGNGGANRLGLPVNVSAGPQKEKYVTDTYRGQVVVYDAEDRPVRVFSREGGMKPCDAVWHDGKLFVADLKSNSILVLDAQTGRVVRQFGGSGSKPGQFFQPTNLAFGPDGSLYVSDTLNARVQRLDREGKGIGVVGSLGRGPGQMVRPKGIAVDRAGRLYVADAATEVVQLFDPEGRLLMALGGPGAGPGEMSLPAKVAVSYEGIEYFAGRAAPGFSIEYLIFVTNQLGPRKINVYGFGTYAGPPLPERDGVKRVIVPAGTGRGAENGGAPMPGVSEEKPR